MKYRLEIRAQARMEVQARIRVLAGHSSDLQARHCTRHGYGCRGYVSGVPVEIYGQGPAIGARLRVGASVRAIVRGAISVRAAVRATVRWGHSSPMN